MSLPSDVSRPALQPLYKWPGGKSAELGDIVPRVPAFSGRFIEPFLGGGAVWLRLNSPVSVVGDLSADVIGFYQMLKNPTTRSQLRQYMVMRAKQWDRLGAAAAKLFTTVAPRIHRARASGAARKTELAQLGASVDAWLATPAISKTVIGPSASAGDRAAWSKSITTKLRRIVLQEARSSALNDEDLAKNVETALRTAFYTALRTEYNRRGPVPTPQTAGAWFFVRDLCYASMFRFNDKGEFNIPYGGMAYNSKRLMNKVTPCFEAPLLDCIARTTFHHADFSDFWRIVAPAAGDFVFLDPPYDTPFNAYDGNLFNQQHQARLANFLATTPADFLLVIQETPFIAGLYADATRFHVERVAKTYQVNVKNRNARAVTHLYISRAKPTVLQAP